MKNKNTDNNAYNLFIDALLSLPGDVRGDILRIGQKHSDNPYLYLFNRVLEKNVDDPIFGVMMEYNLLSADIIA